MVSVPVEATPIDYLRLIAEGWEVIEADGSRLTIQNPEGEGVQEAVIDLDALTAAPVREEGGADAWRIRTKENLHGDGAPPGRWIVSNILSLSSDTAHWYEIQPLRVSEPSQADLDTMEAYGVKAAALATREEAPAEAGERDYPAEFEAWWATYRHRNRDVADYSVKKQIAFDAFYHAALRAQPPAREEAQPVGVVDGLIGRLNTAELDDGTPLYTHPAPDALRVAVEALTEARSELEAYEQQLTGESYNNLKLNSALFALQAEQKGGA